MKSILAILILWLSSLAALATEKPTNAKAEKLKLTAESYYNQKDYDRAYTFGLQWMLAADQSYYVPTGQAEARHFLGKVLWFQGETIKALEMYMESLQIRETTGTMEEAHKTYNNIGNLFFGRASYHHALEYYEKALAWKEWQGANTGTIHRNLGLTHQNLGDPDRALDHYRRSLHISYSANDKRRIAMLNNDIGAIKELLLEYDSALYYFSRSQILSNEIERPIGVLYALNNQGKIYHNKQQYDLAIQFYLDAFAIGKRLNEQHRMAEHLYNLSISQRTKGQLQKSISSLKASELLATKINAKSTLLGIYEEYSRVYELLYLPSQSGLYKAKHTQMNESLRKDEIKNEALAELSRESLLLTKSNKEKEFIIAAMNQQFEFALLSMLILPVIIFLIYIYQKESQIPRQDWSLKHHRS